MIELVPRLRREPEWQPESAARPRLGDYLSVRYSNRCTHRDWAGWIPSRSSSCHVSPSGSESILGSSPGRASPLSLPRLPTLFRVGMDLLSQEALYY